MALRKTLKQLCDSTQYLKCILPIQVRTTYILKRQRQPASTPFNSLKEYKPSKADHYIYDLVEDTNQGIPVDISVILLTFVEGIGQPGDIVSVPPDVARRTLLLQRKAVYASPENIKEYSTIQDVSTLKFSSHTVPQTMRMLASKIVSIPMSVKEPWTLEPWHVALGMRLSNISASADMIEIPESISGPDMSFQNKDFIVNVMINNTEYAPVRCRIHYVGVDVDKDWMYITEEPLFSEQANILKGLTMPKKAMEESKSKKKSK